MDCVAGMNRPATPPRRPPPWGRLLRRRSTGSTAPPLPHDPGGTLEGMTLDHGDPGAAPSVPQPTAPVANPARPSPAEEARTVVASTNTATLASLSADGAPWASFVTYGDLDGSPVLCVSRLAEHGRNLAADPRASLSIVA